MDGLKPVQRKILFTALNNLSSGKAMNTGAFSGTVKAEANYHHGDSSRDGAIIALTSTFSNQVPMFVGEGNFGSRIENAAAATRYTSVKLNPEYSKYLVMKEILQFTPQDDNNEYEPDYYLFSIPIVLVNGISGIAVSLKTDILGYSVTDIKNNVKRVLSGKKPKKMVPYFPEFSGKVVEIDENVSGSWSQIGIVKKESSTQLRITEIPTCYDRSKYISVLQSIKDKGIISNYDDESTENFNISVSVTRKQMEKLESYGIEKALGLIHKVREGIKVLSKDGDKVLEFSSPEDLIVEYVALFLDRINHFISAKSFEYKDLVKAMEEKILFSEFVSSGIDFTKTSAKKLAEDAAAETGISFERAKQLISSMTLLSITSESIEKYREQLKELQSKFVYYTEEATPENVYLGMLD